MTDIKELEAVYETLFKMLGTETDEAAAQTLDAALTHLARAIEILEDPV